MVTVSEGRCRVRPCMKKKVENSGESGEEEEE